MQLSSDTLSYVLTRTNKDCKKYKGPRHSGKCEHIVDVQKKEQCQITKKISYCKLCAKEFCDFHIKDYKIYLKNALPKVTQYIKNSNGPPELRRLVFSPRNSMLLNKNIAEKKALETYNIKLCSHCYNVLTQQNEIIVYNHPNRRRTLRKELAINDSTREWYETKNNTLRQLHGINASTREWYETKNKRNPTGGKNTRKLRKHQGIYQSGHKMGQLKPGFKYSGKKTKTGLPIIIKVKNSK